ncbi:MAG: tetratricopeptide repeat protein [Wenzhouxiangella sp.]
MNVQLQEIMALWTRGDREAAVGLSTQVYSQHPDNEAVALFHSGLMLHQGRFDAAREVLEAAAVRHPESPALAVNLSIARRGCGDLAGAIAAARSAVAHSPALVSAWNALGIALMESGQLDEAERCLSEGLSLHPDNAPLSLHLDQVIQQLGKQGRDTRDHGFALVMQAEALVQSGNPVAAETLLRQALKLYPKHASAHRNLGVLLMQFGRNAEAAEAYAAALACNPGCPVTQYLLGLVQGEAPDTGSAEYVQMLFDSYADRFDQHLVEALEYRVPELLTKRLLARCSQAQLGEVLDLGCGTGLMAEHLAGRATALDGIDLSSRMLEKAEARGLYRSLVEADIRAYLATGSSRWQAIVAADVFCYCGRLDDIFDMAKHRLAPAGLLAFTVESSDGEEVEASPATGRYRHSRDYLIGALERAGYSQLQIESAVLRKNHDQNVEGFIVLAQA